jgi:hypothetical protein
MVIEKQHQSPLQSTGGLSSHHDKLKSEKPRDKLATDIIANQSLHKSLTKCWKLSNKMLEESTIIAFPADQTDELLSERTGKPQSIFMFHLLERRAFFPSLPHFVGRLNEGFLIS